MRQVNRRVVSFRPQATTPTRIRSPTGKAGLPPIIRTCVRVAPIIIGTRRRAEIPERPGIKSRIADAHSMSAVTNETIGECRRQRTFESSDHRRTVSQALKSRTASESLNHPKSSILGRFQAGLICIHKKPRSGEFSFWNRIGKRCARSHQVCKASIRTRVRTLQIVPPRIGDDVTSEVCRAIGRCRNRGVLNPKEVSAVRGDDADQSSWNFLRLTKRRNYAKPRYARLGIL